MIQIKNTIRKYCREKLIERFTLIKICTTLYHLKNHKRGGYNLIVSALDSTTFTCGLADRLRGVVSGYAFAKAQNMPYTIVHQSPFCIDDYLLPNKYDWVSKRDKISWNLLNVKIVTILDSKKYKNRLLSQKPTKQLHIYTNMDLIEEINNVYNTSYTFSILFNELFKPSPCLQNRINSIKLSIREKYLSISFRFINLLGDFPEKGSKPLSQEEQNILINKCIAEIHKIKKENPQVNKVLITADSMKFIGAVSSLDFVYIIPGESGHSGYNGNSKTMMKTMLDFFFISYAEKVYLIKSQEMYASRFAETAARSSEKEFITWLC